MLINLTIENWMSFKEATSFSMLATKERRNQKSVAYVKRYDAKILPISALYGGNAAGKSNFVKAFVFAKWMVTHVFGIDEKITRIPFYLSSKSKEEPSKFCFCILVEDSIYEYYFSVTSQSIIEEKLSLCSVSEDEDDKVLYYRVAQNFKIKPQVEDDKNLEKRLDFICEGTRENQLFLTNTVLQNINIYKNVYDWFAHSLCVIEPRSKYSFLNELFDSEYKIHDIAENILQQLDTGISKLTYKNVPLDEEQFADAKKEILDKIQNQTSICVKDIAFIRRDNNLLARKLYTVHKGKDGYEAIFTLKSESEGTLRLFDLIPAFFCATGNNTVYIIDEVDRSLHTLLVRQLLEYFINNCSQRTRNQLIMTTHDVLLMDNKILRSDAMWASERNIFGESTLIAFSEYSDVQKDRQIRNSYLIGRIGGIPRINSINIEEYKESSQKEYDMGEEE